MLSRFPFGSRADCRTITPFLWDYAQDTLADAATHERVALHLKSCVHCRAEVESIQRAAIPLANYTTRMQKRNGEDPLHPARWAEVRARITSGEGDIPKMEPSRSRPWPIRGAGWAAAAVGIGALGYAGIRSATYKTPTVEVTTALSATGESLPGFEGTVKPVPYNSSEGRLALYAETAFVGMRPAGTCPVVVLVKNRGAAINAELTVRTNRVDGSDRQYLQSVTLPAGMEKRILVYPSRSEMPGNTAFTVELNGPGFHISTPVLTPNGNEFPRQIGYIGEGVGLLDPAPNPANSRVASPSYRGVYCKPENAPDRAIGYDSVTTVVLGKGAERLTNPQWTALREWVKTGGVLLFIGGNDAPVLQTPEAQDLLPVGAPFTRSLKTEGLVAGVLKPDGRPWWPNYNVLGGQDLTAQAGAPANYAVRSLGTGRVIYAGIDLVSRELRHTNYYGTMWSQIMDLTRPGLPRRFVRYYANLDEETRNGKGVYSPFEVSLPPLKTVTLLFLGYFVLVVPVTFVVLKQMRRLNLAWITGPLLAVTFAGATYLFNIGLYTSGTSRRTAGVILANAGEGQARFMGYTDVFFRHAGNYSVAIPHAEVLNDEMDEGYPSGTKANMARSLVTRTNPDGVIASDLPVTNLAFRRFYHEQPISLGKTGISTDLYLDRQNRLRGEIRNDSGRTLQNINIILPSAQSIVDQTAVAQIAVVPPGKQSINAPIQFLSRKTLSPDANQIFYALGRNYKAQAANTNKIVADPGTGDPVLVGRISGAEFGPAVGQYTGSENSVRVVVGLRPLRASQKEGGIQ